MDDVKNVESTNTENQVQETQVKSFNELLENKEYQAEYDKKVQKALETSRIKWEKEFTQKLELEKKEAERLAKMSENEKLQEKHLLLENREKELNRKELVYNTKEILAQENLPLEFAENIVGMNSTAEDIKESIESFKEKFNNAIELRVKQALSGNTPKVNVETRHKTISSTF